jgi:MarR family transcriptional regulator for hemolysin
MANKDIPLVQVTMALTQVARAYTSAANTLASQYGLSQATAWPAVMIGRMGEGVRPGTVADMLGLEPSSVVRLIDQLIDAGLVERQDDPNDRRAKLLRLTKDGQKKVAQIEKALIPFRRELLAGVSKADLEASLRMFASLSAAIERYQAAQNA